MGRHPIDPPLRRPLRIFAFDPMRARESLSVLTVEVDNEPLLPGPVGARVRVVDFDPANNRYHEPVDLDDPAILMRGGLDPTESDPRFHQQMVYAVTTKVLENFDRALGRRVSFRGRPLLLVPHAFRGANAFYDPALKGVCFGYFPASSDDPGANMPGQPVYTCLSHDIIAHEVTHAIVHRLRPHFLEPTNRDVLAFHEGFSDIVAILQHFSFPEVLREAIRRSRGDLRKTTHLVQLAEQFGHATGANAALRTAVDSPDPTLYLDATEVHDRGSLLVGAVFEGFFEAYQLRIEDLLRIATGGTGVLPEGEIHPDLVERLADEAAAAAQSTLTMCIRAFEYLPPVDVTFGDYLRALVTADHDLLAEDGADQRRLMIEAFRRRGIFPSDVSSLSEQSLRFPRFDDELTPMPADAIAARLPLDAQELHRAGPPRSGEDADSTRGRSAVALNAWAKANAEPLHLDPDRRIAVEGFHATFRVPSSGQLQVEVVAQFTQRHDTADQPEFGGLAMRGGSTVVATAGGDVRFVIAKPLASPARRDEQVRVVAEADRDDPVLPWAGTDYESRRMVGGSFRALHEGLVR